MFRKILGAIFFQLSFNPGIIPEPPALGLIKLDLCLLNNFKLVFVHINIENIIVSFYTIFGGRNHYLGLVLKIELLIVAVNVLKVFYN